MNIPLSAWPDISSAVISFLLTIGVLSYLFGDNILFKICMHILVGVSSGFAFAVILHSVIWPQLILPFWVGNLSQSILALVAIAFSFLLIARTSHRFSWMGVPVLAFLAGIGAAAAVGGSVLGTIVPLTLGSINQISPPAASDVDGGSAQVFINGLIFLTGSISTLVYFHFGTKRVNGQGLERAYWIEWIAKVGRFFITLAFGALFAGVFLASLSAFVERLTFLVNTMNLFLH